jgi:hypothetical protein
MSSIDRLCVGCGIIIDRPFWLCQTCEDEFGVAGVPYRDWPEYLKWLKRDAQREEYAETHEYISLDALADDVLGGEIDGGDVEPYRSDALMAYAPYEDEDANREYRQACGIEEETGGREGDI